VLAGAGLGLLAKGGADVPEPVLAAVPTLVALLILGSWIRARRRNRGAAVLDKVPAADTPAA
jgi:hypothetical protein